MSSVGINVVALLAQLGVLAIFLMLIVAIIWFVVRTANRANSRRP